MSDGSLFAYGETAGFVNIPASRDRAVDEARSGAFSDRASKILSVLIDAPRGMTWRELGSILNLHHGQVSGALSNLHRSGLVFMLTSKRDRCHPYVHCSRRHLFADDERIDEPAQTRAGRRNQIVADLIEVCRDGAAHGFGMFEQSRISDLLADLDQQGGANV